MALTATMRCITRVFVSVTDNQILCISYLWGENEVNQERRSEMFETMLELNIPMPLSAFAKIDDKKISGSDVAGYYGEQTVFRTDYFSCFLIVS